MKIYTSYWAQVRNFPKNLFGLSTTIFNPKWRELGQDSNGVWVIDCPPLKPGKSCEGLCAGKCEPKHPQDCAFLQRYREQLDTIDFDDFMRRLINLRAALLLDNPQFEDVDFALIFYEKYDNPCSERWPIQDWLRAHGIKVEEWSKNE